jgi:hypothetical protein
LMNYTYDDTGLQILRESDVKCVYLVLYIIVEVDTVAYLPF